MVTKPEARELIARAVLEDSRMPAELDVILQEPDAEGRDAVKTLPLLLVELDEVERPAVTNSDFVGYKKNDSGERVAEVYESEWQATARIELWTADGSDNNVDRLGETLHEVLYSHDSRGTDEFFTDENGDAVKSLWNFSLRDGQREDDLIQNPSVRRWRQLADIYAARFYVEEAGDPLQGAQTTILDEEQNPIN
jgi:hypothetical protein